jgi:predicted metalloprotease with PDZ domain
MLPPPAAWLGADTKVENGRFVVERIPHGTPAYEAGLDTGDEIVGLADFRVRAADWTGSSPTINRRQDTEGAECGPGRAARIAARHGFHFFFWAPN